MKKEHQPIMVALTGAACAGKTTLLEMLKQHFDKTPDSPKIAFVRESWVKYQKIAEILLQLDKADFEFNEENMVLIKKLTKKIILNSIHFHDPELLKSIKDYLENPEKYQGIDAEYIPEVFENGVEIVTDEDGEHLVKHYSLYDSFLMMGLWNGSLEANAFKAKHELIQAIQRDLLRAQEWEQVKARMAFADADLIITEGTGGYIMTYLAEMSADDYESAFTKYLEEAKTPEQLFDQYETVILLETLALAGEAHHEDEWGEERLGSPADAAAHHQRLLQVLADHQDLLAIPAEMDLDYKLEIILAQICSILERKEESTP